MNYSGYEKDLYHIYESEVMGEAMFGLLTRLSVNVDSKRKWLALARLESQTKQRYLEYVADKPLFADKSRPSSLQGLGYGLLFAMLPWNKAMKMLSEGTAPFMDVFGRLQQHAAEGDAPFFDYVMAHEEAIKAFADEELAGNRHTSLQPVEALLE